MERVLHGSGWGRPRIPTAEEQEKYSVRVRANSLTCLQKISTIIFYAHLDFHTIIFKQPCLIQINKNRYVTRYTNKKNIFNPEIAILIFFLKQPAL